MTKVAVLTVSDRGSRGERDDRSGPALAEWLQQRGAQVVMADLVADEVMQIAARLVEWADGGDLELILTTGGTGVSPRGVTPDATATILDGQIPGYGELMRQKGLEITPRAIAGIRGTTLIVNLPGSPKAALENLCAIWPAVPHTIEKIQDDTSDCGSDGSLPTA